MIMISIFGFLEGWLDLPWMIKSPTFYEGDDMKKGMTWSSTVTTSYNPFQSYTKTYA